MSGRKLLILDLNGTLVLRSRCRVRSLLAHVELPTSGMWMYERSGLYYFLGQCFAKYDVGIYSSCTKHNGLAILKALGLTTSNFAFTWFRTECVSTGHSYDTHKILDFVYNTLGTYGCKYGNHNTIIVDDSPDKHVYNNPENVVIVPELKIEDNAVHGDDCLTDLLNTLDDRYSKLAKNHQAKSS